MYVHKRHSPSLRSLLLCILKLCTLQPLWFVISLWYVLYDALSYSGLMDILGAKHFKHWSDSTMFLHNNVSTRVWWSSNRLTPPKNLYNMIGSSYFGCKMGTSSTRSSGISKSSGSFPLAWRRRGKTSNRLFGAFHPCCIQICKSKQIRIELL